MVSNDRLFIGTVAKQTGLSVDALRYYEKLGLLAPAARRDSGYRVYSPEILNRLAFIKRAQTFGFSLEEIRQLLALRTSDPSSCARVLETINKKLSGLDRQLAELCQLQRDLREARRRCQKALKTQRACPVIVAIAERSESQKRKRRPKGFLK